MTPKERYEKRQKSVSTSGPKERYEKKKEKQKRKSQYESTIKFDTLQTDLESTNKTINKIYSGWQTKETMKNTKSSIQSMYDRLTSYQNYRKEYGITDGDKEFNELVDNYKAVLDTWDDRTSYYGGFKDAEAYKRGQQEAKRIADENAKAPTEDLKALEKEIKTWEKESERISTDREWVSTDDWRTNDDGDLIVPYTGTFVDEFVGKRFADIDELIENKKDYLNRATKIQEDIKYDKLAKSGEGKKGYEKWLEFIKKQAEEKAKKESEKSFLDYYADALASTPPQAGGGGEIAWAIEETIDLKAEDTSYREPNKNWTEEELYQFGARWDEKNPNIAYNYAANLNNKKAMEEKEKKKKKAEKFATDNVGTGTLATIGSIFSNATGFVDYLDDLTDKAAGREVIVEESNLSPFEWGQTSQSAITQNINEWSGTLPEDIPVVGGKGMGDVYGLGTSILQSATTTAIPVVGPSVTALTFFGQGAASGVDDALSRGATMDEALAYGASLGGLEAISEYIGAERLVGLKNNIGKQSLGKLIRGQARAEALEEGFSALGGHIADDIIMGDKSKWNIARKDYKLKGYTSEEAKSKAWSDSVEDIGYNMLSGYVSGGVHATPRLMIDSTRQNKAKNIANQKMYGDTVDSLVAEGLELGKGTQAYKLAEKAKQKIDKGQELSGAEITRLVEANEEVINNEIKTELTERSQVMGKATGELFVETYDRYNNGSDIDAYQNSFNLVVDYAKNNFSADYMLEHKGVLTEQQVNEINKAVIKSGNYNFRNLSFSSGVDISVIDFNNTVKGEVKTKNGNKTNWQDLNAYQQTAIIGVSRFAEEMGMKVRWVSNGLEKGFNGTYEIDGDTITIDIHAGKTAIAEALRDSIVPTASHEIVHWAKHKSNELYRKLDAFVFDSLAKQGIDEETALTQRRMHMEKAHPGVTYTDAEVREEVVARACEDMLANTQKFRDCLESMTEKEKKSLIGKIGEFVNKIKRWINNFLKTQKSNSVEAKAIRQDLARFQEQLELFEQMILDAANNKQASQNEAIATESIVQKDLATKEIKLNERLVEKHFDMLEKNYSEESSLPLDTLLNRYNKVIDMWKELGGELNSQFLEDWNNKVGTDRTFSIFKAQAGYKYNVELSSMCKKGVALFEAIDSIVKEEAMKQLKTKNLGKVEKEILYDILKTKGFEIPCAICYVEQARQREGVIIDAFLNGKVEKTSTGKVTQYKLGWNETLKVIQDEMKAQGFDYTFPSVDRSIATDNYSPADLSMDEATQEHFFEALKNVANKEIRRYNKDAKNKRKLITKTDAKSINEVFKGKLPLNLMMFRTLFNESSSRFMIGDDLLYSSMTTQNLAASHNGLYSLFNAQGGVGGYKTKQGTIVYWGDILGKTWRPETLRNEGGVRNQSNSDFLMYTMLDQAQMYIDFTAKGYYLQAYTKVLSELKLFGLSKGKINASLIPKVVVYNNANGSINVEKTRLNAGLDEKGNPIYDDFEGINHEEAFMLIEDAEYSKSIGGVCIGYSDNHISKLLDDNRIQQIIGFHDKTNDTSKRYKGAVYATNYNGRNEATKLVGGELKTVHIGFNKFIKQAEGKFKNGKESIEYNGKTYAYNDIPHLATDLYLAHCESKGLNPAYSQGGIDFSKHPNYYKLLADFSLYDINGNYAPHQKVEYNMPDQVPYLKDGKKAYMPTKDYIKQELQGELAVRDAISEQLADKSENGIIPQFIERANAMHESKDTKFSDRDNIGNELSKGQQEFFAESKFTDENGNLLRMYHGTENGGYTVFSPKYSDDGITLFLTPSRELANTYSGSNENVVLPDNKKAAKKGNGQKGIYEVFANAKNPYILDCNGANWNQLPFSENIKGKTSLKTENTFDYQNNILTSKVTIDGKVYEKTFDFNHLVEPTNNALEETAKRIKIDKEVQFKNELYKQAKAELQEYYSTFANEELANRLVSNVRPAMQLHDGITRTYNGLINNKTGETEQLNTRFVSKWAKDNGYDGVWFKNVRDVGKNKTDEANIVGDVVVVFDGKQIKSVDNLNPTNNKDIRYADRDFAEQVDEVLDGKFDRTNAVYVGMPPQILQDIGLDGKLPMLTTASHIRNANKPKDTKKHHHGLTENQIKSIPEKIAHPVMIMDSLDATRNSIIVVTDMLDTDKSPIVVSIKTDGKGMYNNVEIDSNFLTGYYGRDGFANFIENNVVADTLLYINKEKATILSTESSTSWLEQLKNYDFDTIIRKTRANVKENNVMHSDRDSTGNTLTKEQIEFFKDSKVRDAKGNLLVVRHGTSEDFHVFDFEKSGKNGKAEGYGFYFSDDAEITKAYGDIQKEVYLNITKPLYNTKRTVKKAELTKLVNALVDFDKSKWGTEWKDSFISNYVNTYEFQMSRAYAVQQFVNQIWEYNDNDQDLIFEVAQADGRMYENSTMREFYDVLTKSIGYDGIIAEWSHADGKSNVYVTFNSEQSKYTNNKTPTSNPDMRFSDRDNVSVYDKIGEVDKLIKENEMLKEDVEMLKERLKLEGKVTHGEYFNQNQLNAVAGHIRSLANSSFDKKTLASLIDGIYKYISHSEDLNWQDMFAQCYDVARMVVDEAKPIKTKNDYNEYVLKQISGATLYANETQIKEAEYKYGKHWRNKLKGRFTITDNPSDTSIDTMWTGWSSAKDGYPNIFDASETASSKLASLIDAVESLREATEIVEEYDIEEQTRSLAYEIYNKFWTVQPIRTTADKYTKEIKRMNFKHRQAMANLREQRDTKLKEQHKVDRQKALDLYKKIRDQKDKEIAEVRELGKKRLDAYKENAERKTKIQSVTANALTLNKWLTKNSKEYHVHEAMKGPVTKLLQSIDFSSKQLLGLEGSVIEKRGTPTRTDISLSKALSQVKDMMADASVGKEELIELYGHGLNDEIKTLVDSVDNMMRTVGDNEFVLNKMSVDELATLDKVVKTIKHAVSTMNKFHTVNHAKGIASLSQEQIEYADSLGKEKVYAPKTLKASVNKLINWDNKIPYYAFKQFGEAGKKIFEAFQDGWDKLSFNAKAIIDYAAKTYTNKEITEWTKDIKTFDIRIPATDMDLANPNYKPKSKKVQMTVPQIMSLYCSMKREQAKNHILQGGIRVADITMKNGQLIQDADGVTLTTSDIENITSTLTTRQKQVADELQKFMNNECATWGNEVSMRRFGYKAFGEDNYFPIESDANNLTGNDAPQENGNSLFKLLNMSFTKNTIEGANNRIVIKDIFDVFASHSSDMAKYNALALPVLDANRWYNYTEKINTEDERFITKSVKASIENAFGKEGKKYITTFLEDINGQKNVGRDTLGKKFFSNAKIASVAANLRVALLQPTAFLKASAIIDGKYLTKALAHKPKYKHAEKYCGMALWKSLGYYDTDISKGLTEKIKHQETWKDKAVEKSMKGAEWGDKITFGYLWNACELEVRDTQKDLKVGSEEFFDAVAKRLREVIYATQVVDSTMTRSQMMRSGSMYEKMLTAFSSEPTLAFNMLQDAYVQTKQDAKRMGKKEALKKNGKMIARVVTAYTITNAVAALIESGFDAFRDDDDEEMDMAKFMELYLGNFAADMDVISKIPILKEMVTIVQGFSSSRTDTEWMQSGWNAIGGTYKNIIEGKGNPVTTLKNWFKTFSYFTGLPFYNAYRDMIAALDKLDILTSEELEELLDDLLG